MNEDQTSRVGWKLVESATACSVDNDISGAIGRLEKAVREFRLCADSHAECYTLHLLAVAHGCVGNFEQASHLHERGLEIARMLNKAYVLIVEHLDGLGIAHSNMGKWQQAIHYFEQALEETRKPIVGLRVRRARVLQHLANVYTRYTNKYAEAIQLYNEAIAISKDCQDSFNIAACLDFKGQAMEASGNVETGLELFEQARGIAEAEGHEDLLAACYAHLAAGYFHLGQTPLAREYCERALTLDQKFGNKQGLSRDFWLLGRLHLIERDEDAALESYRQSFLLARSIKDLKNTSHVLNDLALIYERRLQAHRARSYYEEALALSREIGDQRSEIQLTLRLANFGDWPELFETLNRFLADAREQGFSDLEQDIETGLARLYDERGDHELARIHYERSVLLLEQMRSSFRVEEHLRAFSESNSESYDRLINLSLLLGRQTEAFKYSELARARVLNNLRHARTTQPASELQGYQLTEYRRVCDEIISLDLHIQRLQLNGLTVPEEMKASLRRALIEEAELVLSVKRAAPKTYAADNFDVVDVAGLQARLSEFEQNILVLAYYTTDKNSYVFVISKDSFDVAPLGMDSTALRELVQGFRAALGIRESLTRDLVPIPEEQWKHAVSTTSESYLQPSQRLYDVLIKQVAPKLLVANHVCIIPHGPLHFMPFHALHDRKQFLIERVPVSYAPSATTLSECLAEQFTPVGKVLALGDPMSELPPLRFARQEVETIKELLGTERCLQLTGSKATRDRILMAGKGEDNDPFDCWHLAMHGVFIQAAPHLSYLQLASDEDEAGRVFAFEIAGMERVGRLSILSACQTAMMREARGDELSGLLFSFMAAGSQAVMASLWSVADESTGALMHAFYRNLTNTHQLGLATALQQAQLALLNEPATASPYYWAPFVLHGNWNPILEAVSKQPGKFIPRPPQVLSETLTRAEILFHEGESHLARASMAKEKDSWRLRGDEEQMELNQAIEAFSQALELAPDLALAYRQRGIAYRNLWKAEEAGADLKRAADLKPRDALALASLGLVLTGNGNERTLALESLERAFRLDSKIQLHYPRVNTTSLARTLERLRAEKTIEETTPPLGSSPCDAATFVKRGSAYWQLTYTSRDHEGSKTKAIEDFRRALELDSNCAQAAIRLAWIEYSNYKPGAVEAYARIVDMDTTCAEAHRRLAQACKYHHEVERAVAEYTAALACDPSIEHVYCGLGQTYLELGQWKSALEAFETERSIHPNCFDAHFYLKEFYGAVGRYQEAKTEYEECLRTTEHSLYEGKLGVGLSDEIVHWIKKLAPQEQSGSPQISTPMRVHRTEFQKYLNRGNDLTKAGQIHGAIAVYSELIEKAPSYALAYAYRGACYSVVEDQEKALNDLRKAIELDPECAEAYFNLAVTYSHLGELDQARSCLDRAIVLDPALAKRLRKKRSIEQDV